MILKLYMFPMRPHILKPAHIIFYNFLTFLLVLVIEYSSKKLLLQNF